MAEMDRRDFIVAALGGISLVGAGSLLDSSHVWAASPSSALAPLVRRNIYCLNANSPEIIAYKKAIGIMRAKAATDPTSWQAQANIHGAFSAPPGMIANACRHGNLFFLSWHRVYLYYFERIVRKASGDPTFALPYWGYSPTGNRALPTVFRTPTSGNALYVSQRVPSVNTGTALNASAVDAGTALSQLVFGGFSSSLEGTPHGVVHVAVGGSGGWMSAFQTAGLDPIFWLHHANIDRLWSYWISSGGGRTNPTTSTWLTTTFQFYDENGATVSMTGADVVNTAAQLNYLYGAQTCGRPWERFDWRVWRTITRIPPWDPRILDRVLPIIERPPLPDPVPVMRTESSVRLGAPRSVARLVATPEGKRALGAFATQDGQGRNLMLRLDGIRLVQPPAVYYEVYVNLPANARGVSYTDAYYAGNLDFFGPSPEGGRGREPMHKMLSLLPVYARLRATGEWDDNTVRLTFVPRGATESDLPARILRDRNQAVIERISITIE